MKKEQDIKLRIITLLGVLNDLCKEDPAKYRQFAYKTDHIFLMTEKSDPMYPLNPKGLGSLLTEEKYMPS